MRKTLIITLLAIVQTMQAKTAAEMFMDMPDVMLPYLDGTLRKELVELKRIQPDSTAEVSHRLGTTKLTAMTDDILRITLADKQLIEIGRIDENNYCVIKTYAAPEQESVCSMYDKEWTKTADVSVKDVEITQRPDTMSEERYDELLKMIEMPLVSMTFGEQPTEIIVEPHIPLLAREDKEQLKAILAKKRLKWNNGSFRKEK